MPDPVEVRRPKRTRRLRLLFFALLTIGGTLAALEGLAHVVLTARLATRRPVERFQEEKHCRYDPELGWANIEGLRKPDLFGKGRSFSTNQRGFRGLAEIQENPSEGTYRIVCLGDSFTEGHGVADGETYPAILQSLHPSLEVVNMGLGGYGLDQSWIWYRRSGAPLKKHLLVVSVIAHDLERMLSATFGRFPKPTLRVRDGVLEIRNTPVPEVFGKSPGFPLASILRGLALPRLLGRMIGRPLDGEVLVERSLAEMPAAEAPSPPFEDVTRAILADLASSARAAGHDVCVVYFPIRYTIPREPTSGRSVLAGAAKQAGIPFLDLTQVFHDLRVGDFDRHFLSDGHFSAVGNRLVAETLARLLREQFKGFPRS